MSTMSPFKGIRNKHDEYKRKDMQKYARRKINLKKEENDVINTPTAGFI